MLTSVIAHVGLLGSARFRPSRQPPLFSFWPNFYSGVASLHFCLARAGWPLFLIYCGFSSASSAARLLLLAFSNLGSRIFAALLTGSRQRVEWMRASFDRRYADALGLQRKSNVLNDSLCALARHLASTMLIAYWLSEKFDRLDWQALSQS